MGETRRQGDGGRAGRALPLLARRAPATTSAPRVRVGATGHAVVLSPLILSGSHIALKRAPKSTGGSGARAPAHRVGHGTVAARGA